MNYLAAFLLVTVARVSSAILEVHENSPVTIQCPLNVQYPTWSGPPGLQNPLTSGQTINEAGFEWVNNRDLRITSAKVKHDGNYTCTDGAGNTGTVEVDVQYFSASVELSTSTPENDQVVFTCTVTSNPQSQIRPTVYTRVKSGQNRPPSKSTFQCEPNSSNSNKTKCTMTHTTYVQKEDNGREVQCEFIYKNMSKLTIKRWINFLFPPTSVEIEPVNFQNKVTLMCATNSSNPVSTLTWRIGKSAVASENAAVASSYQSTIMDAEYHGKNITQKLDIGIGSIMFENKVFCCARHRNNDYCESFSLSSAGCIETCFISLLVTIAFIASLT